MHQLLPLAHQRTVMRRPDDVTRLRGLQLSEQVKIVPFAVHHVKRTPRLPELRLACLHGPPPAQRLP